ncbi:MAG TPA: efflux RND transporter periplasmic adaptor subunit [Myxococcaceae bacterium]|nr:efflux RND transporter periplasmic adaptor subunit [Myxococcaceae bacterium]
MFQPAQVTTRSDDAFDAGGVKVTSRRRGKRWLIAGIALVAIVVFLAGTKFLQIFTMIQAGKKMVPPPVAVTTTKVQQVEWQPVRPAVGTLIAIRATTLSAELTGTVREIGFENGSVVKKGQMMVRFDTSAEQAQLQSAVADEALAKQTLERAVSLRKQEVNTQAELESAQARDKQTRATVVNLQAIINKKIIRAPFDGRAGIRAVELGQVVSPGAPIVSLQTVSPIYAEFQLPQQALADVKLGQKVVVKVDVFPGQTWDGTVTTINPEVDPATRNVRMRATVENPDGRLNPGMFANVEVEAGKASQSLVVPATSVIYAPFGDSVYLVAEQKDEPSKGDPADKAEAAKKAPPPAAKAPGDKPTLIAQQQFVRLGERRGDYVQILDGLKGSETVVSNGAFKLRNGQTIMVNNALAPPANFVPTPTDR